MSATQRLERQADADALLTRFTDFYDGVVVAFSLDAPAGAERHTSVARIDIEARDTDGVWHRIHFTVTGATTWLFAESSRFEHRVLSLGIGIHIRADDILLDLSPWTERRWTEEHLERSHQYVSGRICEVETSPL